MKAGRRGPGAFLMPLRMRNFRLLIGGQAISTVGDAIYAVALPWLVLHNGGTPQQLSLVLAVYGVSRLLTVIAGGVLSDRLRPRRVMLLADVIRAALVGVFAALALPGSVPIWQICLVAAPLGACEGLFLPASYAILPDLLEEDQLQAGNAANGSALQLANLLGPALGGALVALTKASLAFALDATTFALSALSLWLIRLAPQPPLLTTDREEQSGNAQQSFFQLLRSWRLLQVALVIVIVGNLALGGLMGVAIPELAYGPLHGGPRGYGAMLATFGGGALLGGIAAGWLGQLPRQPVVILLLTCGQAIGITLLPYVGGLIGACVDLAIIGIITGITNILYLTLIQQQAPKALLGRILSVFVVASLGLYPISVGLAGWVVERFGPAAMCPLAGIAITCAVAFGLLQQEIRALP